VWCAIFYIGEQNTFREDGWLCRKTWMGKTFERRLGMSTDPTGLGNESCISATEKKYINVNFDREDWCSYGGECLIDNLLFDRDMCLLCGYRMKLDVPAVLQRKMDERIRHEILWRKFK
jgi:hypothetical protein